MKIIYFLPAIMFMGACSNPPLEPLAQEEQQKTSTTADMPPAPPTPSMPEAVPPPPPPVVPPSKMPTVRFVPPVVKKGEEVPTPRVVEVPVPSGDRDNVEKPLPSFAPDDSEVYQVVDEMPEFPGGREKMMAFLADNIKYPAIAKESAVEGMAVINFEVGMDGSISNATILRDIGGGCGAEALRVVKMMPNWTPGKNKGKVVKCKFNLPVKFKLAD